MSLFTLCLQWCLYQSNFSQSKLTILLANVYTSQLRVTEASGNNGSERQEFSSYIQGLACEACDSLSPILPAYNCPHCGSPGLEVAYDYAALRSRFAEGGIGLDGISMWRYKELLPCEAEPKVGLFTGATPLIRSTNLAAVIGLDELYVKDDSTNRPTLSYKDRVVATAVNKALEFGFETIGSVSTGNVANSAAALAAEAGLSAFVIVPGRTEEGKLTGSLIYGAKVIRVNGNYDEANRLCKDLVTVNDRIGVVNVNLRSYYSEGAKTIIYEIAEELNWRLPKHIVLPLAGATLLIKAAKAVRELQEIGLIDRSPVRLYGAQAAGSAPIAAAFVADTDSIVPVEPETIASSLAIGNPGDGQRALRLVRQSGGAVAAAADWEIIEGMKVLARSEGIFAEAAGGTTVAVTKKLVDNGVIPRNESVVTVITGNGYKTPDPVRDVLLKDLKDIDCNLDQLRRVLGL